MEKKSIYLIVILVSVSLLVGFGMGFFYGKNLADKFYRGKLTEKEKEIEWWKSQLEMFYLHC
jgi:hypothetical protein